MIKDNQTGQEIQKQLRENINLSTLFEEMSRQAPIYNPQDPTGPTNFDPGQSFESLLVSIKKQNKFFPHPMLAFGSIWSSFKQVQSYVQLYSNGSEFQLMSGISNGVEITVDLETYDSADFDEVGDGLGAIIENKDDFPLVNLIGFSVKPGKMAMIKISPKLFSISEGALDNFNYIDRKCVGNGEIDLGYFERYSLSNCLVAATYTQISDNCPGYSLNESDATGTNLACFNKHMNQVGRWKIEKMSQKQCFPSCER